MRVLMFAAALVASACVAEAAPRPAPVTDVHVHLPAPDGVPALLAAMDRHGIERAVLLGCPEGQPGALRFTASNDAVLAAASAHPERLVAFPALGPEDGPEALAELRGRGACGVKLYLGTPELHDRTLDDPRLAPLWAALAAERVPVILHVNTVRYEDELSRLLAAYPELALVCPHFCGARTSVDRLERLLAAHPGLRFDTSGGAPLHAAAGFAGLEQARDRVGALLRAHPERFLFGSDLTAGPRGPQRGDDWDYHLAANLDLLRAPTLQFWRRDEGSVRGGLTRGEYRGLELEAQVLAPILRDNAERWLAPCR
ncbi:amidohydrolase family protein [Nannocystis pusilla]|uniref:amidohydrolase family protein n=1 Tax=Nannocystis pusilla TaxID=889268 RepID=UPI003BF159E2